MVGVETTDVTAAGDPAAGQLFEPEAESIPGPPLPLGRRVELPGRGTTFVREIEGPPGAPTVVLLHGWIASAGLNWFQAFEPLGEQFRVLAPDLRGHGRGIRSRRRFRLADCADDVAALLRATDTGPVIAVGYSMGGPVAQLLWHRHPDLVGGLVLCSTSDHFVPGMRGRMIFTSMMATAASTTALGQLAARLPRSVARQLVPQTGRGRPETMRAWAAAEVRRHDWRMVMEAGNAIGHYNSRKWIGGVDVPTAVVITTEDRAITPMMQARLAFHIPHASIHRIQAGHVACAMPSFGPKLTAAVRQVADEIAAGGPPSDGADD